jgi:hypothetical protein
MFILRPPKRSFLCEHGQIWGKLIALIGFDGFILRGNMLKFNGFGYETTNMMNVYNMYFSRRELFNGKLSKILG